MSPGVLEDLARWGPATAPCDDLVEAEAYCRGLARSHYENFPLLAWTLPRRLRQPFANVYAWCRWADDLADEPGDPARSLELLGWWREELRACFAGTAGHPVTLALQASVETFDLPCEPFSDLLTAFETDQRVVEYETFVELLGYCRYSANPVGRIVLALSGCRGPRYEAWSDSICTGLQLANFWQDVRRDHEAGRIYLPREDRQRFGFADSQLAARVSDRAFEDLLRFQVERTREYLQDGLPLVAVMPGRMQVVLELFVRGGLKILKRIERVNYRVWETRPVVGRLDVIGLVAMSLAGALGRSCWPGRSRP